MFKEFPHIKRKLPAAVLTAIFILVIITNLAQRQFFQPNEEEKRLHLTMQNPSISILHERLGQFFLGVNDKLAEREFQLAQEYYNPAVTTDNNQVLGSQSTPWQTWLNLKAQKDSQAGDVKYWEKVTMIYPDYIYAYLKLAVISLQKGETKKAQNYIDTIVGKDPGNQEALKLSGYIK